MESRTFGNWNTNKHILYIFLIYFILLICTKCNDTWNCNVDTYDTADSSVKSLSD